MTRDSFRPLPVQERRHGRAWYLWRAVVCYWAWLVPIRFKLIPRSERAYGRQFGGYWLRAFVRGSGRIADAKLP